MGWRGLRSLRDATRTLASNRPRDHKLASAIADCGFYEFKRQLTYKCEWYGSQLVIADRFYPSSQICSPYRASTENAFA
uniref:zinc ribbon domain-containing protein n=1 Tax=Okeania sp. SIO2F4 TaxID=2607790 RepID=UPI0035C90688